jgi:hypothetical protein
MLNPKFILNGRIMTTADFHPGAEHAHRLNGGAMAGAAARTGHL